MYVYVDARACEVADWGPFDALSNALGQLAQEGFSPKVKWERVDVPEGETLPWVENRLGVSEAGGGDESRSAGSNREAPDLSFGSLALFFTHVERAASIFGRRPARVGGMVIVLEGKNVRLRPFEPGELETVWSIHRAGRRARGLSLRGAKQRLVRLFRQSGSFDEGNLLYLALEAEGTLAGEVDVRRRATGLPPGVFELGIELYAEEQHGRGFGSEALRLLIPYLFDQAGAERLEVRTSLDNAAMCRVLEKLGFVREGVLRAFMPGQLGRADYGLFALLRADWSAQGWVAAGRQRGVNQASPSGISHGSDPPPP
jgi:RimJ/RimL family protein N-acetyltransferase